MSLSSFKKSPLSKTNLREKQCSTTYDNFDVELFSCSEEDLNALLQIISLPLFFLTTVLDKRTFDQPFIQFFYTEQSVRNWKRSASK